MFWYSYSTCVHSGFGTGNHTDTDSKTTPVRLFLRSWWYLCSQYVFLDEMQPKIFHSIYFHDPHESCVHNGICTIKLCYIKVFQNIFSLTMVQLAFSWGFTIFRMSHFKLLSKNRLRSNGGTCWCDFFYMLMCGVSWGVTNLVWFLRFPACVCRWTS